MDNNRALSALIEHIDASEKPAYLGWDEVLQWQEGVLDNLVASGLLAKGNNAQSLQCAGCEHHCFMDVVLSDDSERAFIACDHSEMQSQMGRVAVPLVRLQQWQSSARKWAEVVAGLLGIESKPDHEKNNSTYRLGMLKSTKGRRWVSLNSKPLTLEINQYTVPLAELLYFEGNNLFIDQARVNDLLNSAATVDKSYRPDASKREARKLKTQAMYQEWRDEWASLRLKNSNKSKKWYSRQIEKLPTAQGNSAESIRKQLK